MHTVHVNSRKAPTRTPVRVHTEQDWRIEIRFAAEQGNLARYTATKVG